MSNKFSLSVFLQSYADHHPSNAPSRANFRWNNDLNALSVENASSQSLTLAPGETRQIFSGMRTLAQDSTTQYSISLVPLATTTYQLQAVAGTLPNFRTPRNTGADATTQITTSMNGSVVTFTSGPGTYASFSGLIPGLISDVVLTANTLGSNGNSIILVGNGTSSLSSLITAWNSANPSNQVALTSGNGTQVPNTSTHASYTGVPIGGSSLITITANNLGPSGNSIVLTGNGTSSVSSLITAWNAANPSNMISLTSGDGTQIPAGGIFSSYTGTPSGASAPVTLSANIIGAGGNAIILIGDGVSSLDTLIANWNIRNPLNTMSLTSGNGGQIPSSQTLIALTGGVNPAVIDLSGGATIAIQLSGGTTATQLNLISGGVVPGDFVLIGPNFSPANQGIYRILSLTSNSFSVANQGGVIQGSVTLGSSFASELQIYSAAGVQVGDTLIIDGGFSPVTQGSYQVTQVTANALQFVSTAILPQQLNIQTEDIVIYSEAQTLAYIEADQNVEVIINGTSVGNIEPWVINGMYGSTTRPGVFMLKSTIYSLSLQNNSVNSANVTSISVE